MQQHPVSNRYRIGSSQKVLMRVFSTMSDLHKNCLTTSKISNFLD